MGIETHAPAKLNLFLRVGALGADGFHPVVSWMCTIGFFDTLSLGKCAVTDAQSPHYADSSQSETPVVVGDTPARRTLVGGGSPVDADVLDQLFVLSCDSPDLAVDRSNLVVKAAHRLLLEANADLRRGIEPAVARLQKRIPAGAGLGGGSSDAAAALVALNEFWRLELSPQKLHALAGELGSDVPFFLHGASAICMGRGEIITPVSPPARARFAVVMLPPIHVSTPAVYRQFDCDTNAEERRCGKTSQPERPSGAVAYDLPDRTAMQEVEAWASMGATDLLPRLVNDLEPAAFEISPRVGVLREAAESLLGRPVRMSGSGSSLFTLYEDQLHSSEAAETIVNALQIPAHAVALAPMRFMQHS